MDALKSHVDLHHSGSDVPGHTTSDVHVPGTVPKRPVVRLGLGASTSEEYDELAEHLRTRRLGPAQHRMPVFASASSDEGEPSKRGFRAWTPIRGSSAVPSVVSPFGSAYLRDGMPSASPVYSVLSNFHHHVSNAAPVNVLSHNAMQPLPNLYVQSGFAQPTDWQARTSAGHHAIDRGMTFENVVLAGEWGNIAPCMGTMMPVSSLYSFPRSDMTPSGHFTTEMASGTPSHSHLPRHMSTSAQLQTDVHMSNMLRGLPVFSSMYHEEPSHEFRRPVADNRDGDTHSVAPPSWNDASRPAFFEGRTIGSEFLNAMPSSPLQGVPQSTGCYLQRHPSCISGHPDDSDVSGHAVLSHQGASQSGSCDAQGPLDSHAPYLAVRFDSGRSDCPPGGEDVHVSGGEYITGGEVHMGVSPSEGASRMVGKEAAIGGEQRLTADDDVAQERCAVGGDGGSDDGNVDKFADAVTGCQSQFEDGESLPSASGVAPHVVSGAVGVASTPPSNGTNVSDQQSGSRWGDGETVMLVRLKCEDKVFVGVDSEKFGVAAHKRRSWVDISKRLTDAGFPRRDKECKDKWHNLHRFYRRVVDNDRRSGKQSYWDMTPRERGAKGMNFILKREWFDMIDKVDKTSPSVNPGRMTDPGMVHVRDRSGAAAAGGGGMSAGGDGGGAECTGDGQRAGGMSAGGDGGGADGPSYDMGGDSEAVQSDMPPKRKRTILSAREQSTRSITAAMREHTSSITKSALDVCDRQVAMQLKVAKGDRKVRLRTADTIGTKVEVGCQVLAEAIKSIGTTGRQRRRTDMMQSSDEE
ncbi:hypothetical protein CBR_g1188 [Chara braunii]|uniref:Myb-like domain-containing protein n=1 Tax=Chara braunii TaxID=69332 RepID=A0A388KDH2_CHABU|nr:hypothetical protein CBR_g1188 [Chara braunii]|eukprot:GBG68067.1 hypothetical protein CBR_g1188 [Chara braunii]